MMNMLSQHFRCYQYHALGRDVITFGILFGRDPDSGAVGNGAAFLDNGVTYHAVLTDIYLGEYQ